MANNAVTAKARAIHGTMLTREDYTALIHKASIAAAVAYLKSKPLYASVFADTDEAAVHREQAETLINKNVFDTYQRVLRFSAGDKKGISGFYVRRLECDQLIKAVIAITAGEQDGFVAAFPEYIADELSFDHLRLAAAKNLADASEVLRGTIYYRSLAPLMTAAEPDIDRILTTISVCYIKWAFGQIDKSEKGSTRSQLKDFILRKVDADNLLTCYRTKSFGMTNERVKELLIPYHKRLRPVEIDEALRQPDAVNALREMFVSQRVALSAESDIPEINVNVSDYKYFRHRLAVSTNETEALYSLMMLLSAESTDLCRIIEGIRYGLAPEAIEKYLIR
ncbi:MAG: V-type ATPase subunit [Ruminiclostridium sp.]|nr:V-type ATPase subunit [Ruminiclostridium sp.]